MVSKIVVADTSVLINFLRINRMDLIGSHPDSFIATDQVAAEITRPEQQNRYVAAISAGHLVEQHAKHPLEVELFHRLSQIERLGLGECSAIAIALNRNHKLAIDDNRALKQAVQEAEILGNPVSIVRTQDIIVEMIKRRTLTIETADAILADWADNHRFKLKISSFRELLQRTCSERE